MKFLDLFAGIGGFRMALGQLGFVCVASCEIDKYARKAYKAIYGGEEPFYGDIKDIDPRELPDFDLLTGGFPCQAFSVAGKRKGFEDTRGTLFFEIARIAKEKRPKAMLLENVKGLVGHDKGRTLDTIVQTLNDIGYTVDFEVLNSKYFGVPQNRERIFIIAIRDDLITAEPWTNIEGNTVVPRGKRRIGGYDGVKTFNFDWPEQTEVTTRLRDILETDVDEKYYLDEEKTARLVAQLEAKNPNERMSRQAVETFNESELPKEHGDIIHAFRREHLKDGICPTLTTRPESFKTAPLPIVHVEPQMLRHVDIKGHEVIKHVYDPVGVSPTLTTMGGGHREPKITEHQVPKWIPKPDEINRTLRSGGKASLSDKHNYDHVAVEVVGNVNPSGKGMNGQVYDIDAGLAPTLTTNKGEGTKMFEEIRPVLTPDREEKRQNGRRFKEDGEESFTITAQDKHGVAIGKCPRYRIRKLTPLECWRLQGFPDWAFYRAKSAGISDAQLYKQAGNAVTVNVVYEIAKLLKE